MGTFDLIDKSHLTCNHLRESKEEESLNNRKQVKHRRVLKHTWQQLCAYLLRSQQRHKWNGTDHETHYRSDEACPIKVNELTRWRHFLIKNDTKVRSDDMETVRNLLKIVRFEVYFFQVEVRALLSEVVHPLLGHCELTLSVPVYETGYKKQEHICNGIWIE